MADTIEILLAVRDRGTPVLQKFGQSLKHLYTQLTTTARAQKELDRDAQGRWLPRVPTMLDRITGALKGMIPSFHGGSSAMQGFSQSVGGALSPMRLLAGALAAFGAGKLLTETVQISQTMVGLETAFRAAAGGAKEGAEQFEFVRQQSERLGLDLEMTANSYKGMLAAMVASGRTTQEAQTLFLGVAESARAMGLSNEEARGTFVAVQQIMSKGKVTAEELRQQLGERFPIAIGVMAKTLNITTGELNKMMEQGELTADVMIPWAQELSRRFGPELAVAIMSSGAQINRMKNAFNELLAAVGKGGLLDAVGMVAKEMGILFKQMKDSGAAKELGEAFKMMGEEISGAIKEHGPAFVKWVKDAATTIKDNLVPAINTIKTTFNEAFLGAKASLAKIDDVMNTAAEFWTRKASDFSKGVSEDFKKLGGTGKGFDEVGKSLGNLADQFEKTKNKAKESGEAAWKALNDSKAATLGVGEQTKMTAEEVRKLKDGYIVVNGEAVKAGNAMKKAAEEPKEATEAQTGAISDLAKAYSELNMKSTADLQDSANKSAAAFQTILDKGNETKEGLTRLFTPVAQNIIETFGKVPPEMAALFNEMKARTGVDFREINGQGQETATALKNSFESAGSAMGNAIEDAARRANEALSETQKRAKMLDDQSSKMQQNLNDLAAFYSANSRIEYGDTMPELQEQLKFFQREKSQVWLNSNETSARGYQDFLRKKFDEIIGDVQGRIDALRSKESSGSGDNDSLVIGSTSDADVDAPIGTKPPRRSRRSSGAGGGSAGGGAPAYGAGTVVIEGASFNINQTGIDPRAVDARGLVRAMLPALREEVRRGSLSLGGASSA